MPPTPVNIRIDKNGQFTVTIDASHDPWSILATRLVQFLEMDLDEMGIEISNIDKILAKLSENHGTIQ
jgi:hypothetical protein